MKPARWIELLAWGVGAALLAYYAALRVSAEMDRSDGIRRFQALRRETRVLAHARLSREPAEPPDQTLWSAARIRAFRNTTLRETPEGILRIPALQLTVPIYAGTRRTELDRGVGHVEGTASLNSAGNAAIAGHRDGFFRSLQRIKPGESVYVQTIDRTRRYRVVQTRIVAPSEVSVLAPTALPSLTLITCYPFYFVGPAPRRFIVRAVLAMSPRHPATLRSPDSHQLEE